MGRSEPQRFDTFQSEEVKARYLAAYDALLRKWPVAHEERDVPTRLGATHVIVSGPPQAPPLLLLHAFAATATVWRPNAAELAATFRVYAVDVIGQYGKSVSSRTMRSRRDLADWMCDVLDALCITRASFAGSSYGAFVALNQASLAPERVERVVMINPGGVFVSFLPHMLKMLGFGLLIGLRHALRPRAPRPKLSVAAVLGRNVTLRPDEQEWADLVQLVWNRDMRPNAIFPVVFSTAELRRIRVPCLLLMGENDLLYDARKVLQRARQKMPQLQGQLLPGAHHLAAMSQPAEVNAQILRFLAAG